MQLLDELGPRRSLALGGIGGASLPPTTSIAGLVKRGLAFAGRLYHDAGYSGAVDVALVMRPLSGTVGITRAQRLGDLESPYPTMEYRRHERALSSELANDPEPVAWRLVIDLTDALIGRSFEPFHRVPSQPLRV